MMMTSAGQMLRIKPSKSCDDSKLFSCSRSLKDNSEIMEMLIEESCAKRDHYSESDALDHRLFDENRSNLFGDKKRRGALPINDTEQKGETSLALTHWKILKENLKSAASQPGEKKLRGALSITDTEKKGETSHALTRWKILKENLKSAASQLGELGKKSVLMIESKTSTSSINSTKSNGIMSPIRNRATSLPMDIDNRTTEDGWKAYLRKIKLQNKAREAKFFPFCEDYDGFSSRKTRTISESIQAIMKERENFQEEALRKIIEHRVAEILTLHSQQSGLSYNKLLRLNQTGLIEATISSLNSSFTSLSDLDSVFHSAEIATLLTRNYPENNNRRRISYDETSYQRESCLSRLFERMIQAHTCTNGRLRDPGMNSRCEAKLARINEEIQHRYDLIVKEQRC